MFRMTKSKILGFCLTLLLLILCGSPSAQAHGFLLRSEPADNSVLSESPPEIKLWFSEAVVTTYNQVQLLTITGEQIPVVTSPQNPENPAVLSYRVPTLQAGIYTVNWKVISAVDGHLSSGYFVFRLGETTPAADVRLVQPTSENPRIIVEVLVRWAIFGSLLLLGGIGGILTFVIKPPTSPGTNDRKLNEVKRQSAGRLNKLGWITAGILLLIGFFQAGLQISSLSESAWLTGISPEAIKSIILVTPWGSAWLIRQMLILGLLGLLCYKSLRGRIWGISLVFADLFILGAMLAQSMMSHAAGAANPLIPILLNFIHLIAAGVWIGGLLALCVGLLPVLLKDREGFIVATRAAWGPFSRLALAGVMLVLISGIFNTGQRVASFDALILTSYGRVLLTKIILVLFTGLIGLVNSILLHPKITAPKIFGKKLEGRPAWLDFSRFPKTVLAEASLGILVILFAGILTTLPPARGPEYILPKNSQIDPMVATVNDLVINLSIKPNQPGANLFTINVLNSRRPAPAETLRVIVRATYLEQDFGTSSQNAALVSQDRFQDSYRFNGNQLSQPGRWNIEVIVRRKGLSDSRAIFQWVVMPPGGYYPPLVSRLPWRDTLTWVALVLFLISITIVIFGISPQRKQNKVQSAYKKTPR